MSPMKTITLAALLCATLVAVGCGGGDGLSRKELASKANDICAKYSKEGQKLGSPDLADPKKAEDYFNKATDLAQEQQDELTALEPADSVKADYDKLTKATGDATALLSDLAAAAEAKDQEKGVELVQKLTPISEAVDTAAKDIGATSCAG
jgi:hypothetical protein